MAPPVPVPHSPTSSGDEDCMSSRNGRRAQWIDVKRRVHARRHAALFQDFLIFPTDERVLVPIGNGRSAVAYVDGPLVDGLFAGTPRFVRTMVVWTVPADQPQRLDAGAEMR